MAGSFPARRRTWQKTKQLAEDLRQLASDHEAQNAIGRLLTDAAQVEERLRKVVTELQAHGPEPASSLAAEACLTQVGRREADRVMARLRKDRQPAALSTHMLEAELRRARRLLAGFAERIRPEMWAVVGDAGRGKSNLAIALTAERGEAPAGIYLQGRNLSRTSGLEDLLVPLLSRPQGSFRDLLEAVDAAGARAGRRVPIVIDGLNEAEDPARFKPLLSSLQVAAADFPNVLVLLTLRESALGYAMPDDAPARLELPGFVDEFDEAVDRYFNHYKIRRGDARLPQRLLRQPLLLWMFCEVANPGPPEERRPVPLSSLPATPVALFEAFRDESVRRIGTELLGCGIPDVASGLDKVALALWERRARDLPFEEVRAMIDRGADWNHSIARALEDEGVLMREPASSWQRQPSGILFDAFAGFLIADAIVRHVGAGGIEAWLADTKNLAKLDSQDEAGHPLAPDILTALAGVLPRRTYRQLWPHLDGLRREQALVDAADLDRGAVDVETAEALANVLRSGSMWAFRQIVDRLTDVRSDPHHRLNADYIDRVLRTLPVADRDLRWTEWVRKTNEPSWPQRDGALQRDIEAIGSRWRERHERDGTDRLRAVWVSWLLTSTDRRLRDCATEALYRFGRDAPGELFEMTTGALDLDDPYVPERLLAASYGVIMANQRPGTDDFDGVYGEYLRRLGETFRGDAATQPTSHWLMRAYAQGAWDMASALRGNAAAPAESLWKSPFAAAAAPRGDSEKSSRGEEVQRAFGMDFENYTVGGLYDDRSNYDSTHEAYRAGLAAIRGRIWDLGWRDDRLGGIDRSIAESQWRGGRADHPDRVDRYGKKYGWIAYYELAGRLDDARVLTKDSAEHIVDLDPSFPDKPPPLPVEIPRWARATPVRLSDWVRRGIVTVPDELLAPAELAGTDGPWVAVNVVLRDLNNIAGRRAWGVVEALLVTPQVATQFEAAVGASSGWSGTRWPGDPSDYYTYAGEIPWSPKFAASVMRWEENPYRYWLELPGVGTCDAEIVSHRFAWESHHSTTNQQGGLLVPSRRLTEAMGLLRSPDGLDHVDSDGRVAARVFLSPPHFESGNALYIRRDVLEGYAKSLQREVVLVVRGERQPDYELVRSRPQWYLNAVRSNAHEWAFGRRLSDLG
ncbi:NACHT domain-containing protein [Patulibacter minatonensis]|uniref:NACHT domain-containing protein n=1 Tax=Patulibacter minatonensis TaxID=298163 RepID=UPI0012F9D57F|nr:NACHT domain-containing protein [Patulibacter minatonensis]